MNNEADGLIDNDDVVIDIHNWNRDVGLGEKGFGAKIRFDIDNHNVAFCDPTRTRFHHRVVTHHKSVIEPVRDSRAARSANHRHNTIDTLASQR
ncbi:unannotated protein [freshwater metagenome]|uniref:Unannotated protein n=1 Tax=freshwater metagenome TaxID=449393 RepID=A0A6J6QS14_9ZZZZ